MTTPATRLRTIAEQLRASVDAGDFDECEAHVETDMETLPDVLEQIAKDLGQ